METRQQATNDSTVRGEVERTTGSAGPARAFRWVAVATAVLVLIQAILAGRGWFVDFDLIDVHGQVGNVTFLAAAGLVVLGYLGRQRGAVTTLELGLSALMLLLVVAQIGLGYGGRDSGTAASLHVPNGVLIFGVLGALLALVLPRRAAV